MSTRLLIITLLVIFIIGGLMAGLFAGSIAQALTLPMMQSHTQAQPTAAPTKVQATATVPTQMPTNLVAQDTFKRQNQALWGNASDTQHWQGDANSPKDQAIFTIANSQGRIANAQGNFNALLGQAHTDLNVAATGTVNHFVNGANLGVVLRWNDPNNWYKALIDGKLFRVIKDVQGHMSTLSSMPFQAQDGQSYTLRFQAIGPMLFAKVWAASTAEPAHWQATLVDNSLDNGQAGIRVVLSQGTVITIRSFQAMTASSSM